MRHIPTAGKVSWDVGFERCLLVRAREMMHVVIRQTGVTAGHRGDPFARDVMTRLSNLEPLWLPIHSYHGVLIHEFRMLRISLLCSRASTKTRNLTGKYLASSIRPTSASSYLSNSSRDPPLRDPLLQEIQTNWPHLPPPVLLGLQLQHYLAHLPPRSPQKRRRQILAAILNSARTTNVEHDTS